MKSFLNLIFQKVRRVDKADLKRIAKVTGGKILLTLTGGADEAEWASEGVDDSAIGRAECVYEERVGDNDFIFIKNGGGHRAVTMLLR